MPPVRRAQDETPDAASGPGAGEYRVVNLGAAYRPAGKPNGRRFARKGEIIEVDTDEAVRLVGLGAVVGKNDPDPLPPTLVGEGENPYGGKPLIDPVEHAAKVRAQVKTQSS